MKRNVEKIVHFEFNNFFEGNFGFSTDSVVYCRAGVIHKRRRGVARVKTKADMERESIQPLVDILYR